MKELKFYKQNAKKFLIESGYIIGKNGEFFTGYVFDTKNGRFHAKLSGKDENTIVLHFDKLVKGFHTVFPSIKRLKAEKERILTKVHKVIKNEYCYYCTVCQRASGDGDGLIGKKCKLA